MLANLRNASMTERFICDAYRDQLRRGLDFLTSRGEMTVILTLNVEHGIRGLVLREDNVILLVLNDAPSHASFGEKVFHIDGRSRFDCHA